MSFRWSLRFHVDSCRNADIFFVDDMIIRFRQSQLAICGERGNLYRRLFSSPESFCPERDTLSKRRQRHMHKIQNLLPIGACSLKAAMDVKAKDVCLRLA